MHVAYLHGCGTYASVALARARVFVHDMTRADAKIKCKEKDDNFLFITLLPSYVAPVYSFVANAFVYNQYNTVCIGMSSSYVLVWWCSHNPVDAYATHSAGDVYSRLTLLRSFF